MGRWGAPGCEVQSVGFPSLWSVRFAASQEQCALIGAGQVDSGYLVDSNVGWLCIPVGAGRDFQDYQRRFAAGEYVADPARIRVDLFAMKCDQ